MSNIDERLRKLEELIYGSRVSNGLLQTVVSMKTDLNATKERLNELTEQLKLINSNIEELNKKLEAAQSLLIKIAASSAAIGFIAGILISLLLKGG